MPALSEVPDGWQLALLGYELGAQARGLSPRTIANRRTAATGLARWLADEHGITSPEQVSRVHLQLAMKRAHAERSRSGARAHYNDLKSFWGWYAAEYGTQSPLSGIRRPQDVISPVKVLTSKEISSLLSVVSGRDYLNVRDRAIILTLLETGLRREELTLLDLSDVNLRTRILSVRRGKGGKSRVVVCGPDTASALLRLIRLHPGGEALFVTTSGNRMAPCTVGVMLRKRGEAAGVPGRERTCSGTPGRTSSSQRATRSTT